MYALTPVRWRTALVGILMAWLGGIACPPDSPRPSNDAETAWVLAAGGGNPAPVLAAPSGPAGIAPLGPDYAVTLYVGQDLAGSVNATNEGAAESFTVSATVSDGTLTAAQAGFTTAFPQSQTGTGALSVAWSGTAAATGTIELMIAAVDAGGAADVYVILFTLIDPATTLSPPSGPGTITGTAPDYETFLLIGDSLDTTFTASDGGTGQDIFLTAEVFDGTLTATQAGFTTDLPAMATGTGTIALTLTGTAQAGGTIVLLIAAQDPFGPGQAYTLTIRINYRPEIGAPSGPGSVSATPAGYAATVPAGADLAFSVIAMDADVDQTLAFTATLDGSSTVTPGAAGFVTTFPASDSGAGSVQLDFTGTAAAAGVVAILFTANDGHEQVSLTFAITITSAAPQIVSTPATQAVIGVQYSYSPEAIGAPKPGIAVSGYPVWLTWTGTSLVGTPNVAYLGTTSTITVTASNSIPPNAVQTFTLEVVDGRQWRVESLGNRLRDVWGSSATDIFAVGYGGTILHYNGTRWSLMASGTTLNLNGVWGTGPDNVFAVGQWGTILHYDGSEWTLMPTSEDHDLFDIHGIGNNLVVAVGETGAHLEYRGDHWSAMSGMYGSTMQSVWVYGFSDIHGVGTGGSTYYVGGSHWYRGNRAGRETFNAVWGSDTHHLYAIGEDGTYAQKYYHDWMAPVMGFPEVHLCGIWGFDDDNMIVVGKKGTVLVKRNGTWSQQGSGSDKTLYSVWGTSMDNLWAVGEAGTILHYDGSSWTQEFHGIETTFEAIWGSSAVDVYAMGYMGDTLHYDGTGWTAGDPEGVSTVQGLWGTGPDDIFAAGSYGRVYHFDGIEWDVATRDWPTGFSEAWGTSSSNVYVSGWDGLLVHYDGQDWQAIDPGTTEDLIGLWGHETGILFAVGTNGTIVRYSSLGWQTLSSGTTNNLWGVWGSAPDNIFAVGIHGTILHFNGNAWTSMASGTTEHLNAVWGSGSDSMYAVGNGGTILHYDGNAWTHDISRTLTHLESIWGTGAGDIYIAGNWGVILHYSP